jgi:hypothetical protein
VQEDLGSWSGSGKQREWMRYDREFIRWSSRQVAAMVIPRRLSMPVLFALLVLGAYDQLQSKLSWLWCMN